MKLAHWHRSQGHQVTLIRRRRRDLFDPAYDTVYASAIFSDSNKFFPKLEATGRTSSLAAPNRQPLTVESLIGKDYEFYDYHDYPDFTESIGFTKRGCRLAANSV